MITTYLFAPELWEGPKTISLPLLRKGEEIVLSGFEFLQGQEGVYVVSQTLHYLTPQGYHQKVSIRPFKGERTGPLT